MASSLGGCRETLAGVSGCRVGSGRCCGSDSRVADVRTGGERLAVRLQTGDTLSVAVPLWWFPAYAPPHPGNGTAGKTSADRTDIRWPGLGQVVPVAHLAERRGPDIETAAELSDWLLARRPDAT